MSYQVLSYYRTCYRSCVSCHMSCVSWHMSCHTCHVTWHVTQHHMYNVCIICLILIRIIRKQLMIVSNMDLACHIMSCLSCHMSYQVMSCYMSYHISCMYICTWYDTCLKKKSVEKDLLLLHWFQIWDMPIM